MEGEEALKKWWRRSRVEGRFTFEDGFTAERADGGRHVTSLSFLPAFDVIFVIVIGITVTSVLCLSGSGYGD